MKHLLKHFVFLVFIFAVGPCLADERILYYHSDIQISRDGNLTVTETIRVRAEGNNIRRGIYRDFPTRYKDRMGNQYRVDFEVVSVERNGRPEDWHTERMSNGIRTYAGSANRFIEPGKHEYVLQYRTNRQLGYFEDYDELWWNVTGNGWRFPIDQASATIHLPQDVDYSGITINAYTGAYGSTASQATGKVVDPSTVSFVTTRSLGPWENLSVIVAWPKGVVVEPSRFQRIKWFLRDNGSALVLGAGWFLMFGWYLWAWNKVGRDPATGVIIPRFEPPKGLSPAACRYVLSMSFERECLVAAIVSLAVKKRLEIEEFGKEFSLRRIDNAEAQALTPGEESVLHALLPSRHDSIELKQENHSEFRRAKSGLQKELAGEFKGRMFRLNAAYLGPAFLIFVVAGVVAIPFHGGAGLWIIYIISSVIAHILFWFLVRAPTPSGRRIMDQIEGFKRYLDTAERDRLEQMRSPRLTAEIFEAFLPYAYALGVENSWCERFAREVPEEIREEEYWQPAWYHGRHSGLDAIDHIGSKFSSSFSSAISSSSRPPGSSSGSGGGGGFSGGGGGGGGGGGW